MDASTQEPLIWTTKGNLPVSSLRYAPHWEESHEATVFVDEYFLGEESVKRSVHALSKQPLAAIGEVSAPA